jgi:uncharacterized metal-binding protein
MSVIYKCAECRSRECIKGGDYSDGCPSADMAEIVQKAAFNAISDKLTCKVMSVSAAIIRNDDGILRTRLDETIEFCREMGFSTIGVAFCIALSREVNVLCAKLSDAGFQVVPVCCKVGNLTLENYGITTGENISASACNPVAQAAVCNKNMTDINILVGLCVGHDMLFTQNASSPSTTLVVKDRVYKHNPVEALRNAEKVQIS